MAKQLASVSLNMLATEGPEFNQIIAQKYCTIWGHPAILLCNELHNNIDRPGATLGVWKSLFRLLFFGHDLK
jgi:hypothetical protein